MELCRVPKRTFRGNLEDLTAEQIIEEISQIQLLPNLGDSDRVKESRLTGKALRQGGAVKALLSLVERARKVPLLMQDFLCFLKGS